MVHTHIDCLALNSGADNSAKVSPPFGLIPWIIFAGFSNFSGYPGVERPEFGDNPRPVIYTALGDAGVEQRLGCRVTWFDAGGVKLDGGERIDAATVVVTVGLRANGLTAQIPGDREALGRLEVSDDLKVAGLDDVYAIGDVAHARVDDDGNYALISRQHVRTMGKYMGLNVVRDLRGETPEPYR
jgi:NADH dehydrogenase